MGNLNEAPEVVKTEDKSFIQISKKAFLTSVIITFSLMILSGILTYVIPSGLYERIADGGRTLIVPESFHYIQKVPFPVYRWFTAPVEVLFSSDGIVAIMLILFIISVGGGFEILDKVGAFKEIISRVIRKFAGKRNMLICAVAFVFMFFGAVLGMFEEVVTMVPIVVALSYSMGWDAFMGLGMSLLSICFGFTVAVSNPYTVGLAQRLAGVPMFSGALFRIGLFIILYVLLCVFLTRYARKIENNPEKSSVYEEEKSMKERYSINNNQETAKSAANKDDVKVRRAARIFIISIIVIVLVIALASIFQDLSSLTMPLISIIYIIAGIWAGMAAGVKFKDTLKMFGKGVLGIAPGILLLLMALSVNFIIKNGGIMDTVVYNASLLIAGTNPIVCGYLIYAIVLTMEFFIGSASAKAFLLIPIIMPLADMVGLSRQTGIQAFCFGDGFSNIIYPTNPVLLISLGLTTVSYPKWIKWTIKLQLLVLLITCILLGVAVFIRY